MYSQIITGNPRALHGESLSLGRGQGMDLQRNKQLRWIYSEPLGTSLRIYSDGKKCILFSIIGNTEYVLWYLGKKCTYF